MITNTHSHLPVVRTSTTKSVDLPDIAKSVRPVSAVESAVIDVVVGDDGRLQTAANMSISPGSTVTNRNTLHSIFEKFESVRKSVI